jgi:hypothetical protein
LRQEQYKMASYPQRTHRSRWLPSAAVRQRAIAVSTLRRISFAASTRPRLSRRPVRLGPISDSHRHASLSPVFNSHSFHVAKMSHIVRNQNGVDGLRMGRNHSYLSFQSGFLLAQDQCGPSRIGQLQPHPKPKCEHRSRTSPRLRPPHASWIPARSLGL